jgi:LacI family transcriptional regulator
VLVETSRGYARGLIEGIAQYNREHGPWSIFFEPHGLGQPLPKWLRGWRGDGILARLDTPKMLRAIRATGLPTVDLRGRLQDPSIPFIGLDNAAAVTVAVGHLFERGLKNFAFYGWRRGTHRHMDERRDCFVNLVTTAGFCCSAFEDSPRFGVDADWEGEQNRVARWLATLPRPVGLMACNDDAGQRVLDACRRAGLQVPDEIAVIGVDNDTLLCMMSTPPLSSVEVSSWRIGYEAAALLDAMMQGKRPRDTPRVLPPTSVVARQSTDVLAVEDSNVAAALRHIRDHVSDGTVVDQLIHVAGVSRSTLERRFRELLGRSPKEEILRVRLERAKLMLTETTLSIDTIARRSGFPSGKYFGDVFRREVGTPPGTFRSAFRRASKPGS